MNGVFLCITWHARLTSFFDNFPFSFDSFSEKGPLLAKALAEIGRGVEAARRRRERHLYSAKALAVVWVALVAVGVATSSSHPIG